MRFINVVANSWSVIFSYCVVSHYSNILQFIHSPVDGHQSCYPFFGCHEQNCYELVCWAYTQDWTRSDMG